VNVPPAPVTLGSLAAALARRFHPRFIALALLVLAVLIVVGGMGLGGGLVMAAPVWAQWIRLTETTVVGVAILVAVVLADEAVERSLPALPTYVLAVIGASVLGSFMGGVISETLGLYDARPPVVVFSVVQPVVHRLDLIVVGILVGGLATFVHVNRRTALQARVRQHTAERARALARRRTLESQLQALQARVEPLFLFGTLERIRRLYESDAARAGAMLEDLIVYLRAALPHLRESSSTVEQEVTLVRAWLDIVEPDSSHGFAVAAAARGARLPALVLLPLIQQAVAHDGTQSIALRLAADVRSDRLRIEVSTTSRAFAGGAGGQPVLEQIRDRLRALHGSSADVDGATTAEGSEAWIELPLEHGGERQLDGSP
jgi:hypothetical protein